MPWGCCCYLHTVKWPGQDSYLLALVIRGGVHTCTHRHRINIHSHAHILRARGPSRSRHCAWPWVGSWRLSMTWRGCRPGQATPPSHGLFVLRCSSRATLGEVFVLPLPHIQGDWAQPLGLQMHGRYLANAILINVCWINTQITSGLKVGPQTNQAPQNQCYGGENPQTYAHSIESTKNRVTF